MTVSVSAVGFLVLPLGLFLFLQSRRHLFWATVLSIPFFYTFILDFEITYIQPYQYLGALLILRHVVDLALGGHKRSFGISNPTAALIAFLFMIYVSLLMPVILEGTVYVVPSGTSYQEYENVEPLHFRMSSVMQTVYPTFVALLFLSLVREIKSLEVVKSIVRLNMVTAVVVIASGLFFQFALMKDLREPIDALYRFVTGFSDVSRIYSGALYNMMGPLPRMFTLSGEPGFTGAYLLFLFGIVVTLHYNVVRDGWKLKHNWLAEGTLLIGLLLTGSTTGYLGLLLVVVMLLALPRLFRLGAKGYRFRSALLLNILLLVIVGTLALVAPIMIESSFWDYVSTTHYAKIFDEAGSGSLRMETVVSGVEVFLRSPVLGVGYGNHRTASLLTSLLSNVGAFGTLAFLVFNASILLRGVRTCRRSTNGELVSIQFALLVSFCALFPTMLIGKSMVALVHGWYWLLVAMIEGCYRIHADSGTSPS